MVARRLSVLAAFVTLVGLLVPAWATAEPASPAGGAAIRLQATTFTPSRGEHPDIPPGLEIAAYPPGKTGYYLVQHAGPVAESWKDELHAGGAEILDYIPDNAFKVRMTPEEAAAIGALDDVAWIGLFHPAYKFPPDLTRDGVNEYRVRVESGANLGQAIAATRASGAELLSREGNMLMISADSDQIDAVAHVMDIAWIENFAFNEKHNEQGGGVVLGANTAIAGGFDGSTQTVAVADTGLGDGTPDGAHADLPASRITAVRNWTTSDANRCYRVRPDGAQDVDSGHGTHTALSVLGGGGSSGQGRGTAPSANLVFQAVEEYLDLYARCNSNPDGYYLIGLPDDLGDLYQEAYDLGARVHSNSWGSDVSGVYTIDSANTDAFVWNNPDMSITFSAGNDGVDSSPTDGVVDDDSIGSPATAKNVITVGASEGARPDGYPCDTGLSYVSTDAYQSGTCSDMGGLNTLGTGSRWGFTIPPLSTDPSAGNPGQMAPFSSRGPTDDGRIKPDVVAPGTWILSGSSSLYQQGYGDPQNPENNLYQWDGWGVPFDESHKYMGGTSMSNPLVAGGAAVVRDFYQKTDNHPASATLVKATLINSAVDLPDENNDGSDDNDFPIPNIHEGWGRVDLANATDGSHEYVDEGTGLETGAVASYQFTVGTEGSPFRASLVWSDAPSTEATAANLVNNLDLEVIAPDASMFYGNDFAGGWSQIGTTTDTVNNVENVYIESAAAGLWTIRVRAVNVAVGPQPFALVIDGDQGPDVPLFLGAPVESYGGSQDAGTAQVLDGGATLRVTGNGWKQVAFPYTVTANTVLEFDFSSSSEGEIHGIGFDTDDFISPELTFQLYGTQSWGFQATHNYVTGVTSYSIPVGDFYTGSFDRLFFVNDHDIASPTAESVFSNVTVYEAATFLGAPVESYGGSQDAGTAEVLDGGDTLRVTGNGWKKVAFPYEVTANTVLEFDFSSSSEGEIQGIGFDTDDFISPGLTFQLYGTQSNFGIQATHNYVTGVTSYSIPVGDFYTGSFDRLFFVNDHDVASPTAESVFSNVTVYEAATFLGAPVESYGGSQDAGTAEVLDGGDTLRVTGNGWKKVAFPYEVTANTVLEFDFSSSSEGEIQGIGFDTDDFISPELTFQLYGTQSWGFQATHNYVTGVTHYTIPVGDFYTGSFDRLFFVNDHDIASPTAESVFTNVTVTG